MKFDERKSGLKRGGGRGASRLLLLAGLLTLGWPLSAQNATPPANPDVAILVQSLQPETANFRGVILGVIQDRLSELGLQTAALPVGVTADSDAAAAAKGMHAAAVLFCRYSASGSTLDFSYGWADLDGKSQPSSFDQKGPLDINMDEVVLQGLDGVLALEKERVNGLAAARAKAEAAAAPPPPPKTPPPEPAQTTTAAAPQPAAAPTTSAVDSTPAVPPASPAAPSAPQEPAHFLLQAGGAAFVPVGPASNYFAVAGAPTLRAAYEFPVPPGRLAIGLFASSNIFSAVGPQETATGFLIPIGPDVRYTVGNEAPLSFFAHISSGPALLVLDAPSTGAQVGLTAYLKSGLGAGFMVGPRFGLEFSADYEVYFELPYLIMGLSSTLQATVKL